MPSSLQSRAHLIERFAASCAEDDRILAAFLGGSIATETADEHSDLDLYAVIRSDAYDQLLTEHREFVERWATPVFLEHFDSFGFDMLVFILDNGVQGELAIAKQDHFLHIHGGPYKVLVDKEDLLEGVEFPWQRPAEEQQLQVLKKQLNWFWRDLSLFTVAMLRSHIWTAFGYLESMRRRCISLRRLHKEFDSWTDGYEKLESVVSEAELEALKSSFSGIEPRAMAVAVKSLISFYQELAPGLASRHGMEYPGSLQDVVLGATSRVLQVFEGSSKQSG